MGSGSAKASWRERSDGPASAAKGTSGARSSGGTTPDAVSKGPPPEAADDVHCAVTLDADLQHELEAIPRFLDAHAKGAEIVFGVRRDRSADGLLKKGTASAFYGLMRLLGAGTPPSAGGD